MFFSILVLSFFYFSVSFYIPFLFLFFSFSSFLTFINEISGFHSNAVGVKIPSKIVNDNNYGIKSEENEEKHNDKNEKKNYSKLSNGVSPNKYNSPKNVPKYDPKNVPRNVSFSGIACAFNGVEETSQGKGAPLALYVG